MAGRGRGRGRGQMLTFNLEAIGLKRADLFSPNQPQAAPVLYPPVPRMPIPNTNYSASSLKRLEISRSIRAKLRQKSAHLTLDDKKRDIERYSDKYQLNQQEDTRTPDWSQFPEELRPDPPKRRKKLTVRPNLKAARGAKSVNTAEVLAKAKERLGAESTENAQKDDEEEKKEEEDEEEKEEQEEEGEMEELEDEDENDYNLTYFDNGEGYGDDDDDDDEPAYN